MFYTFYMSRIEILNIKKFFGEVRVLEEVNLKIDRGEVMGLYGPNGTGKTTLLKILCGLLEADGGVIKIGEEPVNMIDFDKNRIGAIFTDIRPFENITAESLLSFISKFRGIPENEALERLRVLKDRFNIDFSDKKIGSMSTGMRSKVMICLALIHNPDLIVLDEASNGLDIEAKREFDLEIRQRSNLGSSVVISHHSIVELCEVCTNLVVLKSGRIYEIPLIKDMIKNKEIKKIEDAIIDIYRKNNE